MKDNLKDILKRFYGLPPYNESFNPDRYDIYVAEYIKKTWTKEEIKKAEKELGIQGDKL